MDENLPGHRARSEDGKQLLITEEVLRPGSDEKFRLWLVYDRVGGNPPPTSK